MNEARFREAERELWQSVRLQPSERQIRLAGTGTKVRIQEIDSGAPALFIHGGPNAGSTWATLLQHITGFRCLLVDRPGTGLSEPFAITAENLAGFGASFVADVLDGLEVESAHVVASSFGGHLAFRSAATHPERFRRMVQMACPALSPGEQLPLFLRLLKVGVFRRLLKVLPPNHRANRSIMRQIGHGASLDTGRMPENFMNWYLELQRHTDTNAHDSAMIARVFSQRDALTLSDDLLGRVNVPTQFLWGADDPFGDEDVARYMVSRLPDARLTMIPAAGHLPWLDDPAGVAIATMEFLGRAREMAGAPVPAERLLTALDG
jgi:2-hydroxy-6-oxonona-2,4-dienedioate hydrolase